MFIFVINQHSVCYVVEVSFPHHDLYVTKWRKHASSLTLSQTQHFWTPLCSSSQHITCCKAWEMRLNRVSNSVLIWFAIIWLLDCFTHPVNTLYQYRAVLCLPVYKYYVHPAYYLCPLSLRSSSLKHDLTIICLRNPFKTNTGSSIAQF